MLPLWLEWYGRAEEDAGATNDYTEIFWSILIEVSSDIEVRVSA